MIFHQEVKELCHLKILKSMKTFAIIFHTGWCTVEMFHHSTFHWLIYYCIRYKVKLIMFYVYGMYLIRLYCSEIKTLQRSADDKLPASTLAQASASIALSQIVPILISHDSSRVLPCIKLLLTRLPGTEEGSPVLQFHAGVGLGMFMARIFEEHFSDVCGAKVKN